MITRSDTNEYLGTTLNESNSSGSDGGEDSGEDDSDGSSNKPPSLLSRDTNPNKHGSMLLIMKERMEMPGSTREEARGSNPKHKRKIIRLLD